MSARASGHSTAEALRRSWRWGLASLLWMLLQFWLSDQPKLPGPGAEGSALRDVFNYGAHAASYAVLTVLLGRTVSSARASGRCFCEPRNCLPAAAFAALSAASDEYHQGFVPGRTASPFDYAVDVVGIGIGLALTRWMQTATAYAWGRRVRDALCRDRRADA